MSEWILKQKTPGLAVRRVDVVESGIINHCGVQQCMVCMESAWNKRQVTKCHKSLLNIFVPILPMAKQKISSAEWNLLTKRSSNIEHRKQGCQYQGNKAIKLNDFWETTHLGCEGRTSPLSRKTKSNHSGIAIASKSNFQVHLTVKVCNVFLPSSLPYLPYLPRFLSFLTFLTFLTLPSFPSFPSLPYLPSLPSLPP